MVRFIYTSSSPLPMRVECRMNQIPDLYNEKKKNMSDCFFFASIDTSYSVSERFQQSRREK